MVTWLCWWQGAHRSDRGQGNQWSNLLTNTGPPRGPAAKQPAALRTPFSQGTFLLRCAGPSLQFHPRGPPVPSSCSAPSTASLPFQKRKLLLFRARVLSLSGADKNLKKCLFCLTLSRSGFVVCALELTCQKNAGVLWEGRRSLGPENKKQGTTLDSMAFTS